ncbi:hypothetical protein [Streptomyces sp. NPDC093568]|uniref:hypothetical protein n=1 Tax=Streptomyces sp. NPDC093568 TaxID=3366041 RepID=UPI003824A2EC
MSTYDISDIDGPSENGADPAAVLRLAERLVELLGIEAPALVPKGVVVRDELHHAIHDGLPANRGRIRFALEAIRIGVAAGSGSLALVQRIDRVLGV